MSMINEHFCFTNELKNEECIIMFALLILIVFIKLKKKN